MHVDLTPDQKDLQAELRDYFTTLMTDEVKASIRNDELSANEPYRDLIRKIGADGWLGVAWPEEYGGKGYSPVENYIFFNEAQKAGCPIPFLTTNTVGPTLRNFGTDEQGEARLKIAIWSVYESRLYTLDGEYQPGQLPVRLEIEYLRELTADELVAATRDEWDHLGLEDPRRDAWLEQLGQLWPDVGEHDVLALAVNADGSHRFYLNGGDLGVVTDPEFADNFLAIWLSEQTSRPQLRERLLGE